MLRRRLLLLACSVSALVAALSGDAEVALAAATPAPAATAVPPARSSVEVVLAGGDASERARLTDTLRATFDRLAVDLTVKERAAMNPLDVAVGERSAPSIQICQIWIDLGQPHAATVYLTEYKNVYVRKLALGAHFDAVALELVDVVVTSSVEAVLAGHELGIPRREFLRTLATPAAPSTPPSDLTLPAPVPAPAPAPPAPALTRTPSPPPGDARPHTTTVLAAAFYETDLRSADRATHGPGASIEVRWSHLSFSLAAHGRFPHDVARNDATLRLAHEGVRLSVGRTFALASALVFTAAAAVGAELTYVRTVATSPPLLPAASSWSMDPLVRPFVGLDRGFGRVRIGVLAGVDCDLASSRYVVAGTPTTDAVNLWQSWRFRPVVALLVKASL